MSDENILLKPVREPSLDEFYSLIEKAQETAKKIGLTEEDINAVIRAMREAEMRIVACAAALSGMRDRNSLRITLNSTFWKTRTGNGFLKI